MVDQPRYEHDHAQLMDKIVKFASSSLQHSSDVKH